MSQYDKFNWGPDGGLTNLHIWDSVNKTWVNCNQGSDRDPKWAKITPINYGSYLLFGTCDEPSKCAYYQVVITDPNPGGQGYTVYLDVNAWVKYKPRDVKDLPGCNLCLDTDPNSTIFQQGSGSGTLCC